VQILRGADAPELNDDEVARAYPWPADRRWVRAMMVTTLDGSAVGPDGLSGSISSSADKAVFDGVRRYADAVLVGAGTIRSERYQAMRARTEDQEARTASGQRPAPVACVVSGSLDLPWDSGLFTGSAERPVVLTSAGVEEARLDAAREHADVVVLGGDRVSPAAVLDALEERGLRRIVCEGGPTLLAELVAADLVDEADITVAPVFSGNSLSPRAPAHQVSRFELAQVIEDGGFLMNQYVRAAAR